RLRAERRRAAFARLHPSRRFPAFLRLRRLCRSLLRRRRRVARGPASGVQALRSRRAALAVEHGSPAVDSLRGRLRVGEARRAPARPAQEDRYETGRLKTRSSKRWTRVPNFDSSLCTRRSRPSTWRRRRTSSACVTTAASTAKNASSTTEGRGNVRA